MLAGTGSFGSALFVPVRCGFRFPWACRGASGSASFNPNRSLDRLMCFFSSLFNALPSFCPLLPASFPSFALVVARYAFGQARERLHDTSRQSDKSLMADSGSRDSPCQCALNQMPMACPEALLLSAGSAQRRVRLCGVGRAFVRSRRRARSVPTPCVLGAGAVQAPCLRCSSVSPATPGWRMQARFQLLRFGTGMGTFGTTS